MARMKYATARLVSARKNAQRNPVHTSVVKVGMVVPRDVSMTVLEISFAPIIRAVDTADAFHAILQMIVRVTSFATAKLGSVRRLLAFPVFLGSAKKNDFASIALSKLV